MVFCDRSTKWIREDIDYRGVVISDDLEMKAVREGYGIGEAVSMGLEAGIDLFLVCERRDAIEEALETLERASEDPRLYERIDRAAARIDEMAARYGRRPPPAWEDVQVALAAEHLPEGIAVAAMESADPTERA